MQQPVHWWASSKKILISPHLDKALSLLTTATNLNCDD